MAAKLRVQDFKRVVFFTGAGMSAESGIPTYRGKGGIWTQYNYEDYACQDAFERAPEAVWEFHDQRRARVAACEPHAGHRLLAELEKELPEMVVVTQNIDGMHQRAGSTRVHELHGSLWRLRCDPCGVIVDNTTVPLTDHHHSCGRYFRPDIVWFGDSLRHDVLQQAMRAAQACDLLVCIGTSGVVVPAAYIPIDAKNNGATLVEINPEETPFSAACDLCLRGTASEMLPQLAR